MKYRTLRKVAKFRQNCCVCQEWILRGDCICIMIGSPSTSHKKCEAAMIEYQEARMERIRDAAAMDGTLVI